MGEGGFLSVFLNYTIWLVLMIYVSATRESVWYCLMLNLANYCMLGYACV